MSSKKIYCLAVDDEPLALSVLQKYIAAVPTLELVGSCDNGVKALQMLQQHPVDLIFLDIQMPQIMGTDFIRTLKNPPKVIFTTAYRKYAIEGFELDAVDYLLKPIGFNRFLKAVNKVFQTDLQTNDTSSIVKGKKEEQLIPSLYFRVDRKMIKVFLNEILFIESLKDYIKIFTTGKSIVTRQPLSGLEELLPSDSFIRIHRSYIVAINKIESYNADSIEIAKKELPVGRLYRHDVNKLLNISSILPISNKLIKDNRDSDKGTEQD